LTTILVEYLVSVVSSALDTKALHEFLDSMEIGCRAIKEINKNKKQEKVQNKKQNKVQNQNV
jgi:hypothetical protein